MEWKKVWKKKKVIGIFIGLLCFQIFIFVYHIQQNEIYYETVWGISYEKMYQKNETEYINGFQQAIQDIMEQADTMGEISIFAQTDSFSNRNLEKTKEDFTKLLSVEPILFDNLFLTQFFSDTMQNLLVIIGITIVILILLDENKQGLRCMIFSTANGRLSHVWRKITALFLWVVILRGAFYILTFAVACIYYGKNPMAYMDYPIQSLSLFGDLSWNGTIGSFLGIYFIYQCFALFLIALGIWTVLFIVDNLLFSVGTIGMIGLVTYLLYQFIDSKHSLNFLHYCNPWYLMSSNVFTEYKNLNILGQAINKNTIIFIFCIVVVLLCVLIALTVGSLKYPCTSSTGKVKIKVKNVTNNVGNRFRAFVTRLSLIGVEYYKVLVSQKGMAILFLMLVMMLYQTDFTNIVLSAKQEMYFEFIETYEGVPNVQSEQELQKIEKKLAEIEETYQKSYELYQKGELSANDWMEQQMRYDTFEQDRLFFKEIQTQTDYLSQLQQEKGILGWYVNIYTYQKLLHGGNTLSNVFLIFGIVLLCSGIFSIEKEKGILYTIRASMFGREVIWKKKCKVAFWLTFFLFFITTLLEIGTVAWVYGVSGLSAPVQSIMQLSFFPIPCSIGTFLFFLYLIKFVMLLAVSAFTCMYSVKTNQKFTIGLSFVICVPSLLSMIGFQLFRYISVIDMLLVSPFLLNTQSVFAVGSVFLFFVFLGIASMRSCYKNWCLT